MVLATAGLSGPGRGRQRDPRRSTSDFGAGVVVFHAGTSRRPGRRDPGGAAGRVLNVCAPGATSARRASGPMAPWPLIDWPQGFHRTDIGWRALAR